MQPLPSLGSFGASMFGCLTNFAASYPLVIAVTPGQYHVSWSRLVVLATPEWASVCVLHTTLLLNEGGQMAHHLGLFWGATLASKTPSVRILKEFIIL